MQRLAIESRGFTLIELMVVITIIGLLATTLLASMQNSRIAAQDAQRIQEARQLVTTLEFYRNQNGQYPCSGVAVACAVASAGGAAEVVLKNISGSYTAHATAIHTTLNFMPGPDRTNTTALRYRVGSGSGNSNDNTDPTSYTLVVFLEKQNTYCEINVGSGHAAYNYNSCALSAI